jgi:hypothetical protein
MTPSLRATFTLIGIASSSVHLPFRGVGMLLLAAVNLACTLLRRRLGTPESNGSYSGVLIREAFD